MPRSLRALVILSLATLAGCADKNEGRPNPALGPPPQIKPGRGTQGGTAESLPAKIPGNR